MATKKCPYCAEDIQLEAVKCKHCGSWLAASEPAAAAPPGAGAPDRPTRLLRSSRDRIFLGVCGGIAHYVGMDPTVVRVLFTIVGLASAGLGILAYFLLALIIPSDMSPAI